MAGKEKLFRFCNFLMDSFVLHCASFLRIISFVFRACMSTHNLVPRVCMRSRPAEATRLEGQSKGTQRLGRRFEHTYLLLTEFEVRIVSYGPSLPVDFWRVCHKSRGKNEDL